MPDVFVAHGAGLVSPAVTALFVDGIGVVGLGTLLVLALVRRSVHAHHRKLAHEAAQRGREPLHVGPSVLAGLVVRDGDDAGDGVVLAIEQTGREWRVKGGWRHRWTEARRTVDVRPFYVQRADGQRVRVEPDERVFLVDKLDGLEHLARELRIRKARLSAGEHVFILGDMTRAPDPQQGGYRESAEGWVLRPRRGTRMLISTEPLEARHRRRAAIWRNLALLTLAVMLLWHGALFWHVHRSRWRGRTETAIATNKLWGRRWVRPSKGSPHWEYHYWVEAKLGDGTPVSAEIDRSSYAHIAKDMPLAFRVVDGEPPQIGDRACAWDGRVAVALLLIILWGGLYPWWAVKTIDWWDRKRVVDEAPGMLWSDAGQAR